MHVVGGGRPGVVGIGQAVGHQPHGGVLQLFLGVGQALDDRGQRLVVLVGAHIGVDLGEEAHHPAPALGRQLAAHQVERLDAVGALIDQRDAAIAHVLADREVLGEARAAMHLDGVGTDLEAAVGEEALHHRGHQRHVVGPLLADGLIGAAMGQVAMQGGPEQEGAAGLDDRLGVHQHAAHVGMDDDRIGRAVGILRPRQRAALQAVLGEAGGGLIGGLGLGDPLQAHPDAGLVHHHEHQAQALVLLAHQPADGLLVLDDAGGVAVDAHLLFQAGAEDGVARPRLALGVGDELGHDEQADAPRARRRALNAGQHQVDDVVGHVVLAAGDPDLLARDAIGAVGLRDRLGAQQAKIGAAMGLGQVHRPAPFAGGELGQVEVLLRLGAPGMDRRIGPVRQPRIHGERHVGRGRHLREGQVDHMGHALAAIGLVGAQRWPAALHQGLIGGLETVRRGDRMVGMPGAALLVADAVQGRQDLSRKAAGLLDDLGDHVHRGFGKAGQVPIALDLQDIAQQEEVVADRGLIGHGDSGVGRAGRPARSRCCGSRSQASYLAPACSRPSRRWRSIWS